ncbi:MAG: right-handed parallel beta-helix repeat-containing protein, partial [Lentisphaeria bacterium]|nr:right-handed parallel beta-helix repeat-containing protein [Lentisphaeria bacterium]
IPGRFVLKVASLQGSWANTFSGNTCGVFLGANVSFDDTAAAFSGNGTDVYIAAGAITGDVVWGLAPAYSLFLSGNTLVDVGGSLTLRPGTVLKIAQYAILHTVGTFSAEGAPAAPIHLTDWRDDTVGGDANRDGAATAPGPGWWKALWVTDSGSASFEHCHVAYAGEYHGYGIYKQGTGDLGFKDSSVRQTSGHGLGLVGSTGDTLLTGSLFTAGTGSGLYLNGSRATATGCTFSHNGDFGVRHEINDGIVYADNTFTGNATACVGVGGGALVGNRSWTRGAGEPFTLVVQGEILVDAGASLSVSPGVTVRVARYTRMVVHGALSAVGAAGQPVVFTGTSPEAGWWRGISIEGSGSASFEWCDIGYGGYHDTMGIQKLGAGALTIRDSAVHDIAGAGLRVYGGSSGFLSERNLFSRCAQGIHLGINVSLTDTTSDFADNGMDVLLDGGTVTTDTTWHLKSNYSLFLPTDVAVAAGSTLALGPGTVLKLDHYRGIWVNGVLEARGTEAAPIVVTDWRDDTAGGDANHDGDATEPGLGWWRGFFVHSAGSADLAWCRFRYAGYYDLTCLHKSGTGSLDVEDSSILHTGGSGITVWDSEGPTRLTRVECAESSGSGLRLYGGPLTAADCLFRDNDGYGIHHEPNDAVVYADNTFLSNTAGCVGISGGTIAVDSAWTRGRGDEPFTVVLLADLGLAAGCTLTVAPGVTVRLTQYRGLWLDGHLEAVGEPDHGITFTGTGGGAGWWRAIFVQNAGSATLDTCRIEHAGYYDLKALAKTGTGDLVLRNSVLSDNAGHALDLGAGSAFFVSSANLFARNGVGVVVGINASFVDTTSDFQDNGTDVHLYGGTIDRDVTWGLKPAYSLFCSATVGVAPGGSLSLAPGTVLKMDQYRELAIQGALVAIGTPGAPIQITDWRDDSVGGDANHDGVATEPGPGWWQRIRVEGAGQISMDWCRVAYAGYYYAAGMHKTGTGALELEQVTIEHTSGDGLRFEGSSGAHTVRRCTFTGNGAGVAATSLNSVLELEACGIAGNTGFGVTNAGPADVDARNCWWGSATGPYHPALNAAGQGNRVSDRVLFEPWLPSDSLGLIISPRTSGTLLQGDTLRFRADPAGAAPGNAYAWDFGDGRTAGSFSPGLVTFPALGVNTVTFGISRDGVPDPVPDSRTITVVPEAPAPDLKVTAFSVPPQLVPGALLAVDYSVTNAGDAATPAAASWIDGLYLSQDPFLDAMDTPLGQAIVSAPLAPGASYANTFHTRVSGATEGQAYLILAVDDSWQILDRVRLNGERAGATDIAVPALVAGAPISTQFGGVTDTAHIYKVRIEAGQNLALTFTGNVRVYLRFGAFPTVGTYDFMATPADGSFLTVPAAYPGTWYVLVVPADGTVATPYGLSLDTAALTVAAVIPSTVSNAVTTVVSVEGAGFAPGATVDLLPVAGGAPLPLSAVEVDSVSHLNATIAAGTAPAGTYRVRVTSAGGSAEAPAALTVTDAGEPHFTTRIILPERLGYHQLATLYVDYANDGNAPMEAPLVVVSATQPVFPRKPQNPARPSVIGCYAAHFGGRRNNGRSSSISSRLYIGAGMSVSTVFSGVSATRSLPTLICCSSL